MLSCCLLNKKNNNSVTSFLKWNKKFLQKIEFVSQSFFLFISGGVKLRRQHWCFLALVLVVAVICLGVLLPMSGNTGNLNKEQQKNLIAQLLTEVPLIDGYDSSLLLLLVMPCYTDTTIFHGTFASSSTTSWRRWTFPRTSSTHLRGPLPSGLTRTSCAWGKVWWGRSCGRPTRRAGPSTRTRCRSRWSRLIWLRGLLTNILTTYSSHRQHKVKICLWKVNIEVNIFVKKLWMLTKMEG